MLVAALRLDHDKSKFRADPITMVDSLRGIVITSRPALVSQIRHTLPLPAVELLVASVGDAVRVVQRPRIEGIPVDAIELSLDRIDAIVRLRAWGQETPIIVLRPVRKELGRFASKVREARASTIAIDKQAAALSH
jgi:hypothetical protein